MSGLKKPLSRTNFEHRLAKLDWLTIFDQNLSNNALNFRFYLIHHLHRLNDTNHGIRIDLGTHFYIRTSLR